MICLGVSLLRLKWDFNGLKYARQTEIARRSESWGISEIKVGRGFSREEVKEITLDMIE